MQIKYTGTPGEDLEQITMYGVDFPKGKFVEVTDHFSVRKLSRHPHFEHKGDVEDVVDKREEQALQLLAAVAVDEVKAAQAQEDATVAALTDKEKYGNDQGPSDSSFAEDQSAGGERKSQRGRPRKIN